MQYPNYNMTIDLPSEGNGRTYMDAGIHENVEMTNVEFKTSQNGNNYLAFYFENEVGEKLSHTEYEPKPKKDFNELTEEEKTQFVNRIENQMKRVKQIMTKFIPKELCTINAMNFSQWSNNVVGLLNNNYKGKKVRIKAVYAKNNFTSLPNYSKYTFIESMEIPKDKSRIKILDIDNMEKKYADNEDSMKNEANSIMEGFSNPTTLKNDLPF